MQRSSHGIPSAFMAVPRFLLLSIASASVISCASSTGQPPRTSPLDIDSLTAGPRVPAAPPWVFSTSDGAQLGYREYVAAKPRAVLVFFHGGGAHSGASYQAMATELSTEHHVTVVTPDLRGHGVSSGSRGDAPSTRTVLRDVAMQVRQAGERHPGLPVFLGGHSSGAGLLLNFTSRAKLLRSAEPIAGFVFVAPQLGFRAKTDRTGESSSFATVQVGKFVLHSVTFGLLAGHDYAVHFNYPNSVLERDPLLVTANTVNMANALTPTSPRSQIRDLEAPLGVWLAEEDALIDGRKVTALIDEQKPSAYVKSVSGEAHLSILLCAAQYIGPWMVDALDIRPSED